MKAIKPLLLSLSMLALASGAAYAADDAKSKSTEAKPATPSASKPSSGASGSASSGASASAKYDFDKADKNHDGRISRAEWDEMMKVSASSGSTSSGSTSSGSTSSGSTSAKDTKTPAPSSGKMGDKPATSSSTTSK
jgi:hypothetical protein